MAYLIKQDLYTHLYPEIVDEIIRKAEKPFPTIDDFPNEGVTGYIYKDESTGNLFAWNGTTYIPTVDPDQIITRTINAAIAEIKSYLSRYDLLKLFGSADIPAEVQSEHLKNLVKDVACWHLVKLANPNVNLELFRTGYEDAIKFLEKVLKGLADPEGWPYKPDDPETPFNENNGLVWAANKRRHNHF